MKGCSMFDPHAICDQFECKVKETEKGIQVDITPKDSAKVGSLKALAKACKDFCGCC